MLLTMILAITRITFLDVIIVAILAWSIFSSVRNGFVREAFGLGTVVLALLLSAWFYRPASAIFKESLRTENLAFFLAFFMIFIAALIAGLVVIWLITKFIKVAKLQWFDRLLGAAFGFIRGWVLASVILLGLTAFDVQTERVRNSQLVPYFLPGSRVLAVVTPYDLKARFLVGYRAAERWWREH